VLLIDATALNSSPLGVREGWAKRHAQGTPADVTSLPAGVTTVLVAADFSPGRLNETSRVALLDLGTPVTAEQLARREGGRIDTLRGKSVVVTQRDLLLVPLAPTRVAARQPADRQALSRWLQESQPGKTGVSDYLRQAVVGARAPVVVALDLADAVDA